MTPKWILISLNWIIDIVSKNLHMLIFDWLIQHLWLELSQNGATLTIIATKCCYIQEDGVNGKFLRWFYLVTQTRSKLFEVVISLCNTFYVYAMKYLKVSLNIHGNHLR